MTVVTYHVYPYLVEIDNSRRTYSYSLSVPHRILLAVERTYAKLRRAIYENPSIVSTWDFSDLVTRLTTLAVRELAKRVNCCKELVELLALHIAFKLCSVEFLCPLLLDDHVTEIFLHVGRGLVFCSHDEYGRLKVTHELNQREKESLISVVLLNADAVISEAAPSAKFELRTKWFCARVSADFPPLCPDGPFIVIRRHRRVPLPLELIVRDTEHAAEKMLALLLAIALRLNILIAGEPDSGKTSLASLLLACCPRFWHLVLIEDVREVPDAVLRSAIGTRLRIRALESGVRYEKRLEISKLLHRTPDYIFVGEVQTKDDCIALLNAFASGVRGIATIHARDLADLIARWTDVFEIPPHDLSRVDVIVVMRRSVGLGYIKRVIHEVYIVGGGTLKSSGETTPCGTFSLAPISELIQHNDWLDRLGFALCERAIGRVKAKYLWNSIREYALSLYALLQDLTQRKFANTRADTVSKISRLLEEIASCLTRIL